MSALIHRLYDQNGQETGAILSVVFGAQTTIQQKNLIESQLVQYAFNQIYSGQVLNIYRDIY